MPVPSPSPTPHKVRPTASLSLRNLAEMILKTSFFVCSPRDAAQRATFSNEKTPPPARFPNSFQSPIEWRVGDDDVLEVLRKAEMRDVGAIDQIPVLHRPGPALDS